MAMVVQHNITAMNANRNLGITSKSLSGATEKLSTGYKINRAADNAAGLSISEKMRKQIRGLTQASSNAEDGISAVQTAEGALAEVQDMLQRMNELSTQAANGTNAISDRSYIQDEIDQILTEIDRVAETTKFNETYLLKGGHDTQTNILKGHDAGIKGSFVDSTNNATLEVDLSVGNTVNIAGQDFNIRANDGVKEDKSDSSDSMTKLQSDIGKIATEGTKVSIDGITYVMEKDSDDNTKLIFSAGTGDTYSALELTDKVKDGAVVSIEAGTGGEIKDADGNKLDIATAGDVIARDYTSTSNITAEEAATRIQHALKQANDIGATKSKSKVTYEVPVTTTTVTATLTNNPAATAVAKEALYVYDSTASKYISVAVGDSIKEYADSTKYTIYQAATAGTDYDTNGKALNDLLIAHTGDTLQAGLAVTVTTGNTIANTYFTSNAMVTGYSAYAKVTNLTEVATITGASYEASAKLTGVNNGTVSIAFESIDEDTDNAEEMAKAQKELLTALDSGKINYTVHTATGTTAGADAGGVFSHDFDEGSLLDIDENGVVKYDGTKIAEIGVKTTTTAIAAGSYALDVDSKTDAVYVGMQQEDEDAKAGAGKYTFTIEKGTTQVAEDLKINLHVGADADMNNKINLTIAAMDSESLGVANLNVADGSGIAATYAIDAISDALSKLSAQRSQLGAVQNRLDHTIKNLDNIVENTTSAESTIRDTDMADEMVNYSKLNIMQQAGQAMLAQANQSNQGVLSLLG